MEVTWLRLLVSATFGWLVFLVLFRILTGQINLRGLLAGSSLGDAVPERVQAFVLTLGGAVVYLFLGLGQLGSSGVAALPDVPEFLLAGVTGSQFLYLIGKTLRLRA